MKPDIDLMRTLLLAVEDAPDGTAPRQPSVDGYSQAQIGYQAHLLVEDGLARGFDVQNVSHNHPQAFITSLTCWTRICRIGSRRCPLDGRSSRSPAQRSGDSCDFFRTCWRIRRGQQAVPTNGKAAPENNMMYIIASEALIFLRDGYDGEQVTVEARQRSATGSGLGTRIWNVQVRGKGR
jgi:hypothetical protein